MCCWKSNPESLHTNYVFKSFELSSLSQICLYAPVKKILPWRSEEYATSLGSKECLSVVGLQQVCHIEDEWIQGETRQGLL